jgi:hypothetical protein
MKTPQEEADLKEMLSKIQNVKDSAFDYLAEVQRMSPADLIASGYRNKTNAEAMAEAFKNAQGRIQRLTLAHVRKYPD